ncbi:hypothetical protein [Streptomyces sp. H27-C3]|uniref:hypothetical protein n=1 Tax=Streptomyces sp. H27-C3 TaxID=3046305 RepID=UPI0024BA25AD|nr:hypothetical protein [Streptomyces sp. H27-C3]MDJ0464110.1 hypothetical protein [Streptomyces sp. H27-C3]
MADERDEWLDEDAAERLLRGEPVESADDHVRASAERLSAALDGLARAGGPEPGAPAGLPGEAAALAAFRSARAASPDALPSVRIGAGPTRAAVTAGRGGPGPARGGRPIRFGLAAALAGVALGGVAVAGGTGVLPAPFGLGADPMPESSVSAASTPDPLVSEAPTEAPAAPGSVLPSTRAPDRESATPGRGHGDGGKDGTHDPALPPADDPAPGAGTPEPGQDPTTEAPQDNGGKGGGSGKATWHRTTVQACRDYRRGDLAAEHKRRLDAAARGSHRVARFCDRLLDGSDSRPGDGDHGGDDGGGGDDGSADGGGGKDAGGQGAPGAGGGPVPRISHSPLPLPERAAPSVGSAARNST